MPTIGAEVVDDGGVLSTSIGVDCSTDVAIMIFFQEKKKKLNKEERIEKKKIQNIFFADAVTS